MTAEIVNLTIYRKAMWKAEEKKKVAENLVRFSQEKVEQRRREYEEARIQERFEEKKIDEKPKSFK